MREIPVTASGAVDAAAVTALRAELHARRTLADVFAWARAQTPPRPVSEIVTQDEYTHDVVIALEPRLCLVFDAT